MQVGDEEVHGHDNIDADYYGIWPTIIGLLFAAAMIWFMFAFADGFA